MGHTIAKKEISQTGPSDVYLEDLLDVNHETVLYACANNTREEIY